MTNPDSRDITPVGPRPLTAAVSPTGTPWIPPAAVKWIALAFLIAIAVLGVLQQQFPGIPGFGTALQIVLAVGTILGLVSPGGRSALKVLVVGFALTSMTACTTTPVIPPNVGTDVAKCGTDAVANNVPKWTTAIIRILQSGGTDWSAALDALLSTAGDAGACAWAVVYAELTAGVGLKHVPGVEPTISDAEVFARAQVYQGVVNSRSRARAAQ